MPLILLLLTALFPNSMAWRGKSVGALRCSETVMYNVSILEKLESIADA